METIVAVIIFLFIGLFVVIMVRGKELGTFIGFGTILYGNKVIPDGTIKTKWIVLFFVPVFPLKSYEVFSAQTTRESIVSYTTNYQLKELPHLYKPQVIPVMIVVWPVLILLAISSLVQGGAPNADRPLSGGAPDFTFVTYSGYDGGLGKQQIKLSDLGGQVVFINFCATWSAPCKDEQPVLESVWRQYRNKGVVFLGIGYVDIEAAVLQYLERFDVTYPYSLDPEGKISAAYHIHGAPESYLIDRQGKIIWFKVGPIDEKWLGAELDKALGK